MKCGRGVCGESLTDVSATKAQKMGRDRVLNMGKVPAGNGASEDNWDLSKTLSDRRLWERPPERTRVDLDYQAFLDGEYVDEQEVRVFRFLSQGYRTGDIADELGVSDAGLPGEELVGEETEALLRSGCLTPIRTPPSQFLRFSSMRPSIPGAPYGRKRLYRDGHPVAPGRDRPTSAAGRPVPLTFLKTGNNIALPPSHTSSAGSTACWRSASRSRWKPMMTTRHGADSPGDIMAPRTIRMTEMAGRPPGLR